MTVRLAKSCPRGTYWRGPVLWGRLTVKGVEHRFSLETADPKQATNRLDDEKRRLVDAAYFKAGLTDHLAKTPWRRAADIGNGFVYFVEATDRIKIGFATEWKSRVASLQTGNHQKLTVLGVMRGPPRLERDLHKQFAHLRLAGEWFRKDDDLLEFIDDNKHKTRRRRK